MSGQRFQGRRARRRVDALTLQDGDFAGKRVLVRVDLNVPLNRRRVADDTRIQAALPTIQHLREAGAKVILCSHLGRPKGQVVPELSLGPIARHMTRKLSLDTAFAADCVGPDAEAKVAAMQDGDVLLLENLRFHAEETAGDAAFATRLAGLADAYVNDAFGTAHRAHASTALVAEHLPAYAGLLIEKELRALGDALAEPERPFTAVLGGAKVADKITVIERLIGGPTASRAGPDGPARAPPDARGVDRLVIGGGMAFTFLKAQGHDVGRSLVDAERIPLAKDLLGRAEAAGVEVLLPTDVEEAKAFDAKADHRAVKVGRMDPKWMGLDIGPDSMEVFADAVRNSATVLWNGPMGVFEWPAFQFGTRAVAHAMADCPGTTIVGGGDSAAAAKQFKVDRQVTHVSTGGGASLEFLEGKALPGIVALEQAAKRSAATA